MVLLTSNSDEDERRFFFTGRCFWAITSLQSTLRTYASALHRGNSVNQAVFIANQHQMIEAGRSVRTAVRSAVDGCSEAYRLAPSHVSLKTSAVGSTGTLHAATARPTVMKDRPIRLYHDYWRLAKYLDQPGLQLRFSENKHCKSYYVARAAISSGRTACLPVAFTCDNTIRNVGLFCFAVFVFVCSFCDVTMLDVYNLQFCIRNSDLIWFITLSF